MKYKIKKVLKIRNFFLVFIFYGDLFSKPIGLRNLGNSCYMNSVLQVLAHTDDFKEYFLLMILKNIFLIMILMKDQNLYHWL